MVGAVTMGTQQFCHGLLLFLVCVVCVGVDAGRLPASSRQELKVQKHLEKLNKPPIKSIQVQPLSLPSIIGSLSTVSSLCLQFEF